MCTTFMYRTFIYRTFTWENKCEKCVQGGRVKIMSILGTKMGNLRVMKEGDGGENSIPPPLIFRQKKGRGDHAKSRKKSTFSDFFQTWNLSLWESKQEISGENSPPPPP